MYRTLLLLALASTSVYAQNDWNPSCVLNSTQFVDGVFYLNANKTQLLYPNTTEGVTIDGKTPILRIACPGSKIQNADQATKLSAAGIRCVAETTIKLDKGYVYAQLPELTCAKSLEPTIQLSGAKTPTGKTLLQVGYKFSVLEFISVIDQVAVDSFSGGYIPRWTHHKSLLVTEEPTTTEIALKKSAMSPKINFDSTYDLNSQRTKFTELFNDTALVDKYLPADGSHTFVPSQLVRVEDLFFPIEHAASLFYENTVPVWKSVEEGNWRRVNEIVRQLSLDSLESKVEVWTGTYLSLFLKNAQKKIVYVKLENGLRPAQFLFKYFIDKVSNKGFVLITLNNPHLTQLDKSNTLCKKLSACDGYPEFADFSKGYTYCCSLKDFKKQAQKLGIPVFETATSI